MMSTLELLRADASMAYALTRKLLQAFDMCVRVARIAQERWRVCSLQVTNGMLEQAWMFTITRSGNDACAGNISLCVSQSAMCIFEVV